MMPRSLLAPGLAALLVAPVAPVMSQQAVEAAKGSDSETGARLATLESRLRSKDERVQWQGIHSCVQMGGGAVPMLARLLEEPPGKADPWCAPVAARALVRLGPKAVVCLPATIKVLKDGNMAQKKMVLDVLGAVGPHDPEQAEVYMTTVYNELRTPLRRGKRTARVQTGLLVDCMVRLSEDPKAGIDDLVGHLQGQSAAQREMAVDWLALRGDEARRAIPALREVVAAARQPHQTSFRFRGNGWTWSGSHGSSDQGRVRGKAALLLMQLGAKDLPASAHVELSRHEDPFVRQRAVLELGSLGGNVGARGIQAILRAISDRDKVVSWDAITALGMVGPAASAAVPRLEALARGPDKGRAARAAAALRQIQKADSSGRRNYR